MKIAFVGDALTTRHAAPFNDPEVEIWGLGNGWMHLKRLTRFFELHTLDAVNKDSILTSYYPQPARLGAKEVVTNPSIPDQWVQPVDVIPFPFEEVKAYSPQSRPYFTSSFAWMLAYAMMRFDLGPGDEVQLYGIDMDRGSEYRGQKACFEHWMGYAMGKGVRFAIPQDCPLLSTPFLYALEDGPNEALVRIINREKDAQEHDHRKWLKILFEAQENSRQAKARMHELAEAREHGAVFDTDWLNSRMVLLAQQVKAAGEVEAEAAAGVGQFISRGNLLDDLLLNNTYPLETPETSEIPTV